MRMILFAVPFSSVMSESVILTNMQIACGWSGLGKRNDGAFLCAVARVAPADIHEPS